MTELKSLEATLNNYLLEDMVNIDEYQDKYFFIKRIKELFPKISEDILYTALENINNSMHRPIKKKIFIDKFTEEINKLTN